MTKNNINTRRAFITNTAKAAAFITVGAGSASAFLSACGGSKNINNLNNTKTVFTQLPLPYAYNALETVIDEKTMELHYNKHAAGYSKNLQEAILAEGVLSKNVEEVLQKISKYSIKMRNNAGGHYNHEMFWQCMQPATVSNVAMGNLQIALTKAFGSFDGFKKQFTDAAKGIFGSGWAWLYVDDNKVLKIGTTPNQDNPLMDVAAIKGYPLLALDVWEHAYYLKYQNKRADYIESWWQVVNWNYVEKRWVAAI